MLSLKILDVRVDKVDMMEALCQIDSFIKEGSFHHVITLNAEIIYRAFYNQPLKDLINSADMVTPDGAGVVWASKYLGEPVAERVTGIDLMSEICRQAHLNGWRIFLLGGSPGVAEEAAEKILGLYPKVSIAGTQHGYFKKYEETEVLDRLREAAPDILFVALGAPFQEFWINKYRDLLPVKVAVGVGGSFDVIAGRVKRAPLWMQRMHLEWLARLLREPWRAKRMLALPMFVFQVLKSKSDRDKLKKKENRKEDKKKLP